MSATNQTTHYELPVFIATDKPAWLVDWNGSMNAIDAAIYAAKAAADTAQAAADANASNITTLSGTVTTQGTSITTLTENLTTLTGTVNTITSLIGNGEPTTTDKTIIGAINEINAKVTTPTAASAITYDNTTSGLTGTNAQAAIDENAAAISQINTDLKYKKIGTITMESTDLQGTFCSKLAALLSGKTGSILTDGSFKLMGEVFNGDFYANFLRMTASNCTIDYCTNGSYLRTTLASGSTTCSDLTSTATGSDRSIDVYLKE